MSVDSGLLTAQARERILERFETWLDRTLAIESPPQGIAAEILAELEAASAEDQPALESFYSMWTAVIALTQEVRLQGRAFKQLGESLGDVSAVCQALDDMRSLVSQSQAERKERERSIERDAEKRVRKEILGTLLDLRDRLVRGIESARVARNHSGGDGWLALRFASRALGRRDDAVMALEKGYVLGLERLDDTLDRMGARRVLCEGHAFDPETMNAVDVEETSAVGEGTVLEVYRDGWEWDGKVYRPAQVKVARAPRIAKEGEQT